MCTITITSQGWPIFGALPQIWVNCKFQIWGNDPNLGQKLIFKLEIQFENNSSLSHNYSRTCPKHSTIFIYVLHWPLRWGVIEIFQKNMFWTTKISPNMGDWPKFGAIFYEEILIQIWSNSPVIGIPPLLEEKTKLIFSFPHFLIEKSHH